MRRFALVILISVISSSCIREDVSHLDFYSENLIFLEEKYDVDLSIISGLDSIAAFIRLKDIHDLEDFIVKIQNEIALDVIQKDDLQQKLGVYCSCDSFYGSNNMEASYKPTIYTRLNFNFNFINGRLSSLQGYFSGWTFANSYSLIDATVTRSCDSYYIDVKGTYDYLLYV